MTQFNSTNNPPWARELALGNRQQQQQQPQQQQQQLNFANLLSQTSGVNTSVGFAPGNPLQVASLQPKSQSQLTVPTYGMTSLQFTVPQSSFQSSTGQAAQQLQLGSFQSTSIQQSVQLGQPGISTPLAGAQVGPTNFSQQPNQRIFTGTVTKIHDNFGFVDEDVFFELSSVRGTRPQAGDHVLVEATYNASMPFKWNATRIQVLSNLATQPGQQQQTPSSVLLNASQLMSQTTNPLQSASQALVANLASQLQQQVLPLMAQTFANSSTAAGGAASRFGQQQQQQLPSKLSPGLLKAESLGIIRGRDHRIRDRRDRRDRSPRRRSVSPRRSRSPRRSPDTPQYSVQISKLSLDTNGANVIVLKSRYSNLYIPSDFFVSRFLWTETFTPTSPFPLGHSCAFHVMEKGVDPPRKADAVLEPDDVNHLFSAKVMLLCMSTMESLYRKSCGTADSDANDLQHPARLIQFLVGQRGKNEPMALGGPWSPSLDGQNPRDDPRVLIRTAIRTVLALTGIDLSRCSKWYKFAEVRYVRQEGGGGGGGRGARVETVVVFMPDVWTCMPTALEWEQTRGLYRQLAAGSETTDGATDELQVKDTPAPVRKREPAHYSLLDPKNMKLSDLQAELEARGQSSHGLKTQLMARLAKALMVEEEEENIDGKPIVAEPKKEVEVSEDAKKRLEEEERRRRERESQYQLPDAPAIVVHPSATAKSGKFDCAVVSLSVLLDYRPEDNKEHSFEVSLFAELFNEMLTRDFALAIYKCLVVAPEKTKDEARDKDANETTRDADVDNIKKEPDDSKVENNGDSPHTKKRKLSGDDNKKKQKKSDRRESKFDKKEESPAEGSQSSSTAAASASSADWPAQYRFALLAFVYYDVNHAGYILDKDIEDIVQTIGLYVSRAQVRKLVQKVVSDEKLYYKQLLKTLVASGRRLDDDKINIKGNALMVNERESVKSERPQQVSAESSESSLVTFNGALVDVASLMKQLERSEQTRVLLESRMISLQQDLESARQKAETLKREAEKNEEELIEERMRSTEQSKTIELLESERRKCRDVLNRSKAALSAVVNDMADVLTQANNTVL